MATDDQLTDPRAFSIDGAIDDNLPGEDCGRGLDDEEAADYPLAASFTAAGSFRRSRGERNVHRIVIHITDGQPNYQNTVCYFKNPTRNGEPLSVSAHYVVGQGGEVVQMVRNQDVAFHAGRANEHSIGIEHCARSAGEHGPGDPGFPVTEEQYLGSAYLVKWLCEQYELPLDRAHILGHAEADPTTTHTDCPAGCWDWDHYMGILTALK